MHVAELRRCTDWIAPTKIEPLRGENEGWDKARSFPVSFYIHAHDQHRQIDPMSLSAATAVVRATALAQRARGSRVWADEQGKLFVKEAGCPLGTLWITNRCVVSRYCGASNLESTAS